MDKNMISIDELVRQRLGGGEEQERAGAWANMRELLDKEMPQERPGGIYWRRALSAMTLLLLVATAGMGSYKLYNNSIAATGKGTQPGSDVAMAGAPKAANTPATVTAATMADMDKGNESSTRNVKNEDDVAGTALNTSTRPNKTNNNTIHAGVKTAGTNNNVNNIPVTTAAVVANTTGNEPMAMSATGTNATTDAPATITTAGNTGAAIADNSTGTPAKHKARKSLHRMAKAANDKSDGPGSDNNVTQMAAASVPAVTDKAAIPASETTAKSITTGKRSTKAKVAVKKTKSAGTDNKTAANHKAKPASVADATGGKALAASEKNTSAATGQHATDHKTTGKKIAATHKAAKTSMKSIALAGSMSGSGTAAKARKLSSPGTISSPGNTVIAKAVKKGKAGNSQALAAAANNSTAAAKNAAKLSKAGKNKLAGIDGANSTTDGTKQDKTAKVPAKLTEKEASGKKLALANMMRGKRVIQKMEIYQHLVKNNTESAERKYHMDTLSIETLTEETNAPEGSDSKLAGRNSETDVLNSSVPANSKIAPASDETKIKNAGKKKDGMTLVEHMEQKFNDIKYNIAAVQFAPGLTAGINGTFFGPSSFKGFQFGVTGDFVLNDTWSIMGELKYIHRVNNNYSMNENGSTYSYNKAVGSYEKDSFSFPYSFSTLHSFELPITVRYTQKKMTFYGGANFAYTLGINPSKEPQLDPTQPVYVQAAGQPTAPKFTPNDLESVRFGIGYVFGFTYKFAPDMALDLRNVQTVWDNTTTAGTKYVSAQLYKSPSLQLSFMYTFGQNKDK